MIIGLDFDGTVVKHKYPEIGDPIPKCLKTLHNILQADHELVLFTMRSGNELNDAVNYLEENNVDLYGVNHNPDQDSWTSSPKAYANLYIDDAALGVPLVYPPKERPYVNWAGVRAYLIRNRIIY